MKGIHGNVWRLNLEIFLHRLKLTSEFQLLKSIKLVRGRDGYYYYLFGSGAT